ncbi:glycosylphosphatidylinositol anchor biosynthesis [Emydomyces testavorans]|uniref:Mannosyltransferase n=1 Tax=Emydomyces testavorans TaxID=2070801 RepID=A0AAF0IJA7_9EURO|nr:glycosylphosphatidylinositol anchor biosynthesis [Emydomyces testavorans]
MSTSQADLLDSSIETDGGDSHLESSIETLRRKARHVRRHIQKRDSRDILLFLLAFRILNALCVRTFFQPDEFFQSLEPAWQIAFGKESGAWITWEWKHHLRSSIHPYIFSAVYLIADEIGHQLRLSPLSRADLLIAAPKATQGVFAAVGDYYTWRLADKVFGAGSDETWWTLGLTVLSPWQWFCSTRTLSNSLETTLTVAALYYWPWEWSLAVFHGSGRERLDKRSGQTGSTQSLEGRNGRRLCLLLAAFACILRPTNLIIWLCLVTFMILNTAPHNGFLSQNNVTLAREALCCGFSVLSLALLADRAYYGSWTLPPLRFLYFNIAQSLAVFYGRSDWHYYLLQGYPLLLTTALPFALAGLSNAFATCLGESRRLEVTIRQQLAVICVIMPMILSLISHKEVRFIYPLLPSLHVLTAPILAKAFKPTISSSSGSYLPRRLLFIFLILVNLMVAYYATVSHASGPIKVLDFLRTQDERVSREIDAQKSFPQPPLASHIFGPSEPSKGLTVGFLMPCHSTPWRSHLVFPTIHAWALTCEPPVNFNYSQRAAYVDEADQFYADPSNFLRTNMVGGLRHFPHTPSYQTSRSNQYSSETHPAKDHKHNWPDYLVFFAQLEPTLKSLLRASSYTECYRTWNTAWHDDWRRKGDMVVWCVDAGVQRQWREKNSRVYLHEDGWEAVMKSKVKQLDKFIEQLGKESAGVWRAGGKKSRRGNGWVSMLSFPRRGDWKPRNSVSLALPWRRNSPRTRRLWSCSWSWPWEKRRKRSWSQGVRAWYVAITSDKSESESSDLWS